MKKTNKQKAVTQSQRELVMRRVNMRLFIGLIIGAILFLLPSILDAYNKYQEYPKVITYKKSVETLQKKSPLVKEYNQQVVQYQKHEINKISVDFSKIAGSRDPIGYLDIPAININDLLIFHGDSDWVLNHGLGNIEWTSLPSGGKDTRATITGHSGLANQIFFDNIKFLKKGDKIYLNSLGQKLRYQVTGQKVVDPSAANVNENFYVKQNKDEIILMTCTPVFVNSHRLLVFAKRDPGPDTHTEVIHRDFWSLTNIWMMIISLLMLLFIIGYLIQRHKYKKILKEIQE